jgi:hypothetical protein
MKIIMKLLFIIFPIFFSVSGALAIDHKNLDENRPLRLEDAYSISEGEWAFEAGFGFISKRHASEQVFFPLQLIYGALPNFHLEIGTTIFTDPHEIDEPEKSGDLSIAALYNFNQETMTFPAFGIKGVIILPTGVDSSGIDAEMTAMITKSFSRVSMHFNAAYEFIGRAEGERAGRYRFVVGPSYPLGAPLHTRTTLIADIFLEQAAHYGENEIIGAEAGLRYQLSERIVVDAGAGSEFGGPDDRSRFFINAGFSFVLQ